MTFETQNGTSLVFHFSISAVNNQLPADFYINGSLKNSSITTSGIYNAGGLVNTYISKLNVSGNQNYTSGSITKTMRILVIIPLSLSLNGVRSNSSITYGTSSDIVVNSSNAFVSLYINNTLTVGPVKNNLTYIKLLPAGYWKITAASNSSSTNITLYQKISKATPLLLLTVTPGSFVYNGNPDTFNLDIYVFTNPPAL